MADIALAKFWRQHGEKDADEKKVDGSSSSWTKLHRIAQLPACRRFLIAQRAVWEYKVAADPTDAEAHATYASFCEKLGDFETACEEWGEASALSPGSSFSYQHVRAQRQLLAARMRKTFTPSTLPPSPNSVQSVVKRAVSELSYRKFMEEFACRRKPVILTGLSVAPEPWTRASLRNKAGHYSVPVKRAEVDSVLWARLEDRGEVRLADFIDAIEGVHANSYVHDWGLQGCEELLRELTIPKYFVGDVLQHLPEGTQFRDSWPSLFVGPKDTESALHVDAFRSNFWMALFEGRKRWVFFDPDDVPLLYPLYANGTLDPVFQVDAKLSPAEQKDTFPLFQLARPYECILEPGEILFVPSGSPHYVQNLTHTVAISGNYIDFSNFNAAKEELHIMGYVDPRASELATALRQPELMLKVSLALRGLVSSTKASDLSPHEFVPDDIPHLSYSEFKLLAKMPLRNDPVKPLTRVEESDSEDDGTEALFLSALAQSRPQIPKVKKPKIF